MSEHVLLGFTDTKILKKELFEINNEYNFLGFHDRTVEDRECFRFCSKCIEVKSEEIVLHFLLQIYCPVDDDFHRTLLVYQCRICGNFDVFRHMKRYQNSNDGEEPENQNENELFGENNDWGGDGDLDNFGKYGENDDWGDTGDIWGDSEPTPFEKTPANSKSTPKTTSKLSKKLDPYVSEKNLQILKSKIPHKERFREFLPYYISVETEASCYGKGALCLDDDDDEDGMASSFSSNVSSNISTSKSTIDSSRNHSEGNIDNDLESITMNFGKLGTETLTEVNNYNDITKGGVEKYEKLSVSHGDLNFYKFAEYVKKCPDQILRYSCNRSFSTAIPFNNKAQILQNVRDKFETRRSSLKNMIFRVFVN